MKISINIILTIIFVNISMSQKNLEIKILNNEIENGKIHKVLLINNSKQKFCFLIDTINYERNLQKYIPTFHNPEILLRELQDIELPTFKRGAFDGTIGDYSNTTKKYIKPQLIFLKAGKILNLKIPFNVISNYKYDGLNPNFYKIDKSKKYFGIIKYIIKTKYIKSILSKKLLDSVIKKGYKFFTGELLSNKVPFIIDQSANYEPAGFYDK